MEHLEPLFKEYEDYQSIYDTVASGEQEDIGDRQDEIIGEVFTNVRDNFSEYKRLIAFAEYVLKTMEQDEEWNADTMQKFDEVAHELELATCDDFGNFKRTTITKKEQELGFVEGFDGYACENDMIQCDHQGYHVVAKIERDDHYGIDDDDCHSVDQEVTGCNDEQFAWLMHCRSEWGNDEWFYCGIVLSVFFNGVEIEEHAASLWGIECNYPQQDGKTDNSYLRTVANELLPEAIEAAKKRHEELIQKLTK